MKRPDKAGIIRRLFDSSTEANANFAAVNVRNDSVVLVKIFCVCCKWRLPSDDVGSSPSIQKTNQSIQCVSKHLTFSTYTNDTPNSCNHWNTLKETF